MSLVRRYNNGLIRQRLTAVLLLVVSFIMLLPVLMHTAMTDAALSASVNTMGKDVSVPFPCQNRPCGCRSAKQCWKNCCCFTHSQKLAWAKAHRVKPPAWVTDTASSEQSLASAGREECCEVKKTGKKQRISSVAGYEVLKCQGVEYTVLGQLVSVVPPSVTTVDVCVLESRELLSLGELSLASSNREPPIPPPRLLWA